MQIPDGGLAQKEDSRKLSVHEYGVQLLNNPLLLVAACLLDTLSLLISICIWISAGEHGVVNIWIMYYMNVRNVWKLEIKAHDSLSDRKT